jgi:hypothetical protein
VVHPDYEGITFFSKSPEPLTQRYDVTSYKTLLLRNVSYYYISKAIGQCSLDARGPLVDDQCYMLPMSYLRTFQTKRGTGIVLAGVPDTVRTVGDVRLRSQIFNSHYD